MSDLLNLEAINSLPHPLMALFCGGDEWVVHDIDVTTNLMRIDVSGMLDVREFCEVRNLIDAYGNKHGAEQFWSDYEGETSWVGTANEELADQLMELE